MSKEARAIIVFITVTIGGAWQQVAVDQAFTSGTRYRRG